MKTIEEVQRDYPYASVMPIEEFAEQVELGYITSYDGVGYYHDGEKETAIMVTLYKPLWLSDCRNTYPYICWYGK